MLQCLCGLLTTGHFHIDTEELLTVMWTACHDTFQSCTFLPGCFSSLGIKQRTNDGWVWCRIAISLASCSCSQQNKRKQFFSITDFSTVTSAPPQLPPSTAALPSPAENDTINYATRQDSFVSSSIVFTPPTRTRQNCLVGGVNKPQRLTYPVSSWNSLVCRTLLLLLGASLCKTHHSYFHNKRLASTHTQLLQFT